MYEDEVELPTATSQRLYDVLNSERLENPEKLKKRIDDLLNLADMVKFLDTLVIELEEERKQFKSRFGQANEMSNIYIVFLF